MTILDLTITSCSHAYWTIYNDSFQWLFFEEKVSSMLLKKKIKLREFVWGSEEERKGDRERETWKMGERIERKGKWMWMKERKERKWMGMWIRERWKMGEKKGKWIWMKEEGRSRKRRKRWRCYVTTDTKETFWEFATQFIVPARSRACEMRAKLNMRKFMLELNVRGNARRFQKKKKEKKKFHECISRHMTCV